MKLQTRVAGCTVTPLVLAVFGSAGQVNWDGPIILTLTDRTFKVLLSDEEFNKGLLGLKEGKKEQSSKQP